MRTKPGIKLPRANSGWELANLFFKSELLTSDINRDNLNETIASMNSTTILQKITELLKRITRKTMNWLKSMENLA